LVAADAFVELVRTRRPPFSDASVGNPDATESAEPLANTESSDTEAA
jgi:hypothetical protein